MEISDTMIINLYENYLVGNNVREYIDFIKNIIFLFGSISWTFLLNIKISLLKVLLKKLLVLG